MALLAPLFAQLPEGARSPEACFNPKVASLYSKAWSAGFLRRLHPQLGDSPWLCGPEEIGVVADSRPAVAAAVAARLRSEGLTVEIAADGPAGVAACERLQPDLVVLDMMMPKRSGFLVLEKLRRSHPSPVRVVMITANEGSRHKAYAEMLGVDDYIRKPFAMEKLVDAVQRLLADIEAGRIDCVVVYKVDRLSRSLMDFARIVDLFDKHGASFVSVTQQFNTTTSMGRQIGRAHV